MSAHFNDEELVLRLIRIWASRLEPRLMADEVLRSVAGSMDV